MKKALSLFLSLLFLLFALVSCGEGTPTTEMPTTETPTAKYKNDIPVINLCKNTLSVITLEDSKAELTEINSTVLDIEFGDVREQNLCDQFTVFQTKGVSFDEIGIFHVSEAKNLEAVVSILKNYVKGKAEDQIYRSYYPGEEYKLDKAEVRTFGNYVIFGILSNKNRSAFFAEIERLLKK